MEEVKNKLIQIIEKQLQQCQENKTVPSKELLDTINTLNVIYYSH